MIKIDLPKTIKPLVLIGNVIEKLKQIPDHSVDCIVTSPPYWALRDYGTKDQIGTEEKSEEYVNRMVGVGNELRRVLKKTGGFFLNIGDTYNKKNLSMVPSRVCIGLQNSGWMLRNFIAWYKPNHMPSSVKNRFGNTWEPIFFLIRDDAPKKYNFDLDSIRVEHKTKKPEPKSDLPYILSVEEFKKLSKKIELPVGINGNGKGDYKGKFSQTKKINFGASPGARKSVNGEYYSLQRKHEVDSFKICSYLKEWKKKKKISAKEVDKIFGYKDTAGHWFRTDECGRSVPSPEDWVKLKRILGFDNKYDKIMTEVHYVLQTIRKHPKGKNPGDMWHMQTAKLKDAHFAVFPEELPKRAILATCPKEGVVLDPFAGSGTTGKVAMELGRKSILIELNKKYHDIIKKRCGLSNKSLS